MQRYDILQVMHQLSNFDVLLPPQVLPAEVHSSFLAAGFLKTSCGNKKRAQQAQMKFEYILEFL